MSNDSLRSQIRKLESEKVRLSRLAMRLKSASDGFQEITKVQRVQLQVLATTLQMLAEDQHWKTEIREGVEEEIIWKGPSIPRKIALDAIMDAEKVQREAVERLQKSRREPRIIVPGKMG